MTIEQHIVELRAELKNVCAATDRRQIEVEFQLAQINLTVMFVDIKLSFETDWEPTPMRQFGARFGVSYATVGARGRYPRFRFCRNKSRNSLTASSSRPK